MITPRPPAFFTEPAALDTEPLEDDVVKHKTTFPTIVSLEFKERSSQVLHYKNQCGVKELGFFILQDFVNTKKLEI